MKMFVVLALAAAAVAEPEAAADAQYISTYGAAPLTAAYSHVASPLTSYVSSPYVAAPPVRTVAAPLTTYSHVASPFVKTVAAPAVRTVVAPAVKTVATPLTAYSHVASPLVKALASHAVTSYNSPKHYTAVSNGLYGPSYVAKNGAVQHVVKREADPALVYNTPLASAYAVASPFTTTYNRVATPLTTTYNSVATPLTTTYNHVTTPLTNYVSSPYVAAPLTNYAASYNGLYNRHVIGKREAEAEADPALIYGATPLTAAYNHVASPLTSYVSSPYVAAPLTTTYNHVATPLTAYNNIAAHVVASPLSYAHVATPLASNGAHAVAATTMGWTHSANVGVCTNVNGQQVAC